MAEPEDVPFKVLRRTWQPVALSRDLPENGVRSYRLLGEELVLARFPDGDMAACHHPLNVTPAEMAGAVRADRQSRGTGGSGAAHTFGWMFETLGVRLIGLTAALDNLRSAKLIDAAGFVRMGEREAVRADGTIRRSLYWEMTRDQWRQRHRL